MSLPAQPRKSKYYALQSIAGYFHVTAWIVALLQVIIGLAVLGIGKDKDIGLGLLVLIGCLVAAVGEWIILTAIAEAITLFIDIAADAHMIVLNTQKPKMEQMIYCGECGAEMQPDWNVCPQCGTKTWTVTQEAVVRQ